jgi:hypothetical protein
MPVKLDLGRSFVAPSAPSTSRGEKVLLADLERLVLSLRCSLRCRFLNLSALSERLTPRGSGDAGRPDTGDAARLAPISMIDVGDVVR